MFPLRMCVACRQRGGKEQLIRIVKPKDAPAHIDGPGNSAGRGAYVCKKADCIENARKRRALNRALKCEITDSLYDELHIIIDGGEQNGCKS